MTGAMWFPNLGPGNKGPFSYLGAVVQHPYDENDGGGNTNHFQPDAGAMRGYVGVLGPLKPVELYSAASSRSNNTDSASGYNKGCGLANRCDSSGSWGKPQFEHCKLQLSLKQLRQREMQGQSPQYRTGGLGRKMQPSVFEVRQSACQRFCVIPQCVCVYVCVCFVCECEKEK
jgi:hypothetical protein